MNRQYRRMYTLPGKFTASATGAKSSSASTAWTVPTTRQLTKMLVKRTFQFSQKAQIGVNPTLSKATTGKTKQVDQSVKVTPIDSEFID